MTARTLLIASVPVAGGLGLQPLRNLSIYGDKVSVGLASRVDRHHPESGGNLGEFVAMHRTGRILWRHRQRTPFNSAALTTAGGLVFIGAARHRQRPLRLRAPE